MQPSSAELPVTDLPLCYNLSASNTTSTFIARNTKPRSNALRLLNPQHLPIYYAHSRLSFGALQTYLLFRLDAQSRAPSHCYSKPSHHLSFPLANHTLRLPNIGARKTKWISLMAGRGACGRWHVGAEDDVTRSGKVGSEIIWEGQREETCIIHTACLNAPEMKRTKDRNNFPIPTSPPITSKAFLVPSRLNDLVLVLPLIPPLPNRRLFQTKRSHDMAICYDNWPTALFHRDYRPSYKPPPDLENLKPSRLALSTLSRSRPGREGGVMRCSCILHNLCQSTCPQLIMGPVFLVESKPKSVNVNITSQNLL
ncbi:uncharacterized protein BDR25DRAFT_360122 [Lindgomyces ingoldianus]|uniref:Uncharacterized protein n=1 Tax=Lindgomyces ingoldianus TaxID=673940 RepID=A0ACB6QG01_9PLEO|nr:uncharacterized protein BDR25DRAFT_360122 [Lindgomyces ingoldianus]KAF2465959.1 hypothetical protein BDR25DRAFT_360122 [Lindgomyces ingoldianus]